MNKLIFTNDNDTSIVVINHTYTKIFRTRVEHEPIFRKIISYLIKNKLIIGNIVDSGAWIGDNAIPWAKQIEGLVYAIDPSPDNLNFIMRVSNKNCINNIITIQNALSDIVEDLYTDDSLEHCMFTSNNTKKIKVTSTTLDTLYFSSIIDNIGFIHLDVESFEFKALVGASTLLEKFNPIIAFEQHLELDNYKDLVAYLSCRGYKVFLIDEILKGCRPDCRNFLAIPEYSRVDINDINIHIGYTALIEST